MNKVQTLMTMVLFLVFSTLLAQGITGVTVSGNAMAPVVAFDPLTGLLTGIGFFFQLMTFQVQGIPSMITLLIFYPLTVGIFYLIIEMTTNFVSAVWPFGG